MNDLTQKDFEELLNELQTFLKSGESAYELSAEQLAEFVAMDQRATHIVPATLH